MTSTISTYASKPWTAPSFDQPMASSMRDLKPLGEDRMGQVHYAHRLGEVVELQEIDTAHRPLPNLLVIDIGGGRFKAFGAWSAPGSYERIMNPLMNPPVRPPSPPKPLRAVDLRELYAPTRSRPQAVYASRRAVTVHEASGPAEGPAGLFADLTRAGISVALAADRQHLVVSTQGGRFLPDLAGTIDTFGRLLAAYLRGEPLNCEVGDHKKPRQAVTVIVGSAACCAECLS